MEPNDLLPAEQVTTQYELVLARFRREHDKHTTPLRNGEGFSRRLNGVCRHVRDQISGSLIEHVFAIEGHIWSNGPGVTLCLACSRQALQIEKYLCGCCGQSNPYRPAHYRKKDTACAINTLRLGPLSLHIPLCTRCEQIIVRYLAQRVHIGPLSA